jgi:hypothetical protein
MAARGREVSGVKRLLLGAYSFLGGLICFGVIGYIAISVLFFFVNVLSETYFSLIFACVVGVVFGVACVLLRFWGEPPFDPDRE